MSSGSALVLALLLGGATARRPFPRDANWTPSAPTQTAGSDQWTHLKISHRPTDAPRFDLRFGKRQVDTTIGIETCGFYPEDGAAFVCPPGRTCANIGDFRDCCVSEDCTTSSFSTTCLNFDNPACDTRTEGTTCCDQVYPYCATYLWSTTATPNRIFTLFNCYDKIFSGQSILDAEPRFAYDSTTSTPVTSPTQTPTTTPDSSPAPATATPVGAVVGGVVGGLAVIGIVVIIVFYMFFRNRRAGPDRGSYLPAAKHEPEGPDSPIGGGSKDAVVETATHVAAAPVSNTPPPVSVSPLSGGTTTPVPVSAVTGVGGGEMPTSPMSKEVATSPLSKEMPTSPASKEMPVGFGRVELPVGEARTAELPG
ncbi:hypothetical protein OQA88_65 [Cercophora sp. LCS_1]